MINLSDLGNFDCLDDLNKELNKRIEAYNDNGLNDFEGLSPRQMFALQRGFSSPESPIKLNQLSEEDLEKSPLLMQVRFLMDKMKGGTDLKLTKTGALPIKIVKEVYDLGYLKNEWIEDGTFKLYKEADAPEISISRILLQISSLAKVRNGKLSLTKKGEQYVNDGNFILMELLTVLCTKFNWGFYDGYDSGDIGRIHSFFILFLLKKYGNEKRPTDFYAERYFRAIPSLLTDRRSNFRCLATRAFDRYFFYFGFIDKEREGIIGPIHVKTTDLLDKFIQIV